MINNTFNYLQSLMFFSAEKHEFLKNLGHEIAAEEARLSENLRRLLAEKKLNQKNNLIGIE